MGLLLPNQKPQLETPDVSGLSSRASPATSTTCHFLSIWLDSSCSTHSRSTGAEKSSILPWDAVVGPKRFGRFHVVGEHVDAEV